MYIISFLQGLVFYSSVATLYRQAQGITLLQMGIIESVFAVSVLIFEIPWGIICDRIGYKKTLLIVNFLYLVSKLVFWKADSFLLFLIERILLAVVVSGLSGCDTAFIYTNTKEDESSKVFGIYHACGTLGLMLSATTTSLFLKDDITVTGLWTVIPYGTAFVLTFLLNENPATHTSVETVSLNKIKNCLCSLRQMVPFLIAAALFLETSHTIGVFYNQLQYERANIPVKFFGIIYTFITLCSLANVFTGKLTKKMSVEKLFHMLYLIAFGACTLLFMTSSPILSVLGITILQICEAFYYPITDTILNRSVQVSRATTLSVYSMAMNLIGVLTNLTFGKCGDYDVTYTLFSGMIFLVIGFVFYRYWKKSTKTLV